MYRVVALPARLRRRCSCAASSALPRPGCTATSMPGTRHRNLAAPKVPSARWRAHSMRYLRNAMADRNAGNAPIVAPDPRLTPARPDLAAKHLDGKVTAARFVEGELREIIEPQAAVRRAPAPDAPLDTEALKGERVMVYETTMEGWSWGQLDADGYVGWLPASALRSPGPAATHKVAVLRTFVFPGPSIKLPPVEALSLGCRLAVAHNDEIFAVTTSGGHVPKRHLAP